VLAVFPLLLLPVAATFGWLVGRRDKKLHEPPASTQLRQDYFKGLNSHHLRIKHREDGDD